MTTASINHDRRTDIRFAASELVREWRLLGVADEAASWSFYIRRHAIIADARTLLADEKLLGPWEEELLAEAAAAPERWNYLAMSKVGLALRIAEDRATGKMPADHYAQEAAKVDARGGPSSPLAIS